MINVFVRTAVRMFSSAGIRPLRVAISNASGPITSASVRLGSAFCVMAV